MSNPTILVVDDSPVNLKVFKKRLGEDVFTILTASLGEETLQVVQDHPELDLVLLDVNLPDINGIEVCRRLKLDPLTASIPILLTSAVRVDDDSIREGLGVGADGFIPQPVEDVSLKSWVRAALRISSLQRALARRIGDAKPSDEELLHSFAKLSHAVNNPLQALFASADMLSIELNDNPNSKTLLDEIFNHGESVAKLVATASLRARKRLEG